ncbi:hypothetical protein M1523_01425 [Patescibacteria group bacterium]|nr:hypothetical protein [Patescibacteria group bacterium]MCL5091559.1 hypothetical protein [Patescibacteria group bacterium]
MIKKIGAAIIALVMAGGLVIRQTRAQSNVSLSVFPAIQEKTVRPNETTRLQIQFRNAADNAVAGKVKVADFVVKDNSGTPVMVEPGQMASKYGAAAWITPSATNISIPGRDFVTIDLTIKVPAQVSTCSKHAIVYFEPISQTFAAPQGAQTQTQTTSSLTAQLGGLVNLLVENNQCKEMINISTLKSAGFSEYGPLPVSFSVFNLGDFFITPQGTVTVYNAFNQLVEQKTLTSERVFPEASRQYSDTLGHRWMIGRYKIAVKVSSNGKNPVVKEATVFAWIFPWRVAVAVLLTIVIIVLLARGLILRTAKYEAKLEKEISSEKSEIEKLKEELRKRHE